jgi:hypothetical protein
VGFRRCLQAGTENIRGKKPEENAVSLAKENGIVILATEYRMYTACGLLYSAGLYADGSDKVE